MLKFRTNWVALLGMACLLSACNELTGPSGNKKSAKKTATPSVISAMAQTKPMDRSSEELKFANVMAAKKSQKLAQAQKSNNKKNRATEAMLPSRNDQYTILFDLNSNQLNDAYKGELVQFAEFLNKHPDKKIHVDGFTCELGSAEYNVALGQRRAHAVAKYLETKGVQSKQVVLVSYGKERPTDPSHNELAWMKNRRVEVFF